MRFIILLIFTLLAPVISAESVYTDSNTDFVFPEKISGFSFEKKVDYGEEELGYGVNYLSESKTVATIIIFNYGLNEIQEGIEGQYVNALYDSARRDIRAAEERGRYKSVDVLPDLPGLEAPFLVSSYDIKTEDDLNLRSHLLMRGHRKYFLKIRISGDNNVGAVDDEAVEFVNELLPVLGIEKEVSEMLPAVSP